MKKVCEELGFPIVIKPLIGSWGRLIAKVSDFDSLLSIIEYKEYLQNSIHKIHYFQEYINKPNRDIRVFVVGDSVPIAIFRISNFWKTNTALGASVEKCNVTKELEELSIKVAKVLKGHILGVDILEDNNRGYLVNEVNAIVEFRNTVKSTGFNLPMYIVKYIVDLMKR